MKQILFLLTIFIFFIGCQEQTTTTKEKREVIIPPPPPPPIIDHRVRPTPNPNNYTIYQNDTLIEKLDFNGTPLEYIVFDIVSSPSNGNINLNKFSGKFIYRANTNFEGNDTFSYHLIGADDESQKATVNIEVIKIASNTENSGSDNFDFKQNDTDNDFIPDDIEVMLGMNKNSIDENHNNIIDGLELEGEFGDTFFDKQWHIRSLGTTVNNSGVSTIAGNDMNITNIYSSFMGYNGGNPIIVSVVDDGVDADHEDLIANMDLNHSRDAIRGVNGDPSPHNNSDTHGTMCAGIIGARAFNGKGVRGIAPFVKIAGNNWLSSNQTLEELTIAWLSENDVNGTNEIAISSNSWGSGTGIEKDIDTVDILRQGTSTLRGGKGRIYVKASGNGRGNSHCANLSYSLNNPYIITVGALSHENKSSSYSTQGANLLVSAYAGHFYQNSPTIGTTTVMGEGGDTTWDSDFSKNYTYAMNGTSAATPGVAGALALVIEACPNLTYRDIKYLIAKTATKIDTNNQSWVQNSAGLWHSIDYGYGLINAQKMILECKKSSFISLPHDEQINATKNDIINIPDNNINGASIEFDITQSLSVEYVSVTLDIEHTAPSELAITLTSPSGTKSNLLFLNSNDSDDNTYFVGGGRLSSSGFVDENSTGIWKVNISDQVAENEGKIKNAQINIIGYNRI